MKVRTLTLWAALGACVVAGSGTTAATVTRQHAAPPAVIRQVTVTAKVTGPSETAFFTAVLKDLGAPLSKANLNTLADWVPRESTWPPAAAFNPLNSTLPEPGATAFNTLKDGGHVWIYPDASTGAEATAATIGNRVFYPHILADLLAGRGLCDPAAASDFSTWSVGAYTGPTGC